jgi:hypothetical protein
LVGYSARFGESARLDVELAWQTLEDVNKDYTVFVHVLNERGMLVAQQDSRPRHGSYPTQFWEKGEQVLDQAEVRLESARVCGTLHVHVGLYETKTHQRVSVVPAEGEQYDARLGDVYVPCAGA